ncbi:hypothetical protein EON65_46715 [archaeon]|nr:MAG: hypothetical protein EON65_46715 [archaeon]
MTSVVKACVVCGKGGSSYKCPQCLAPYCSKDCCVTHKTTCNHSKAKEEYSDKLDVAKGNEEGRELIGIIDEAIALNEEERRRTDINTEPVDPIDPSNTITNINTSTNISSSNNTSTNFSTSENNDGNAVLSDKQKDRLLNNAEILKSLLKSKRLRDDIAFVDSSADRLVALRNMRSKNAEFNGVMENILNIIHEG